MTINKANSPSNGTDTRDTLSDSPIRNIIAAATLSAGMALSGSPAVAETTAQVEAVREMCIVDSKAKSSSLKHATIKRAAAAEFEKAGEMEKAKAEMEKVVKLENSFKKLVDGCIEMSSADGEKAKADQEKAKADQEKAKADQEKAKADQEKAKAIAKRESLIEENRKLDELDAAGSEISAELGKKIQIVEDFSKGKITQEQYQKGLVQLPQIIERANIWLTSARKVTTDAKANASLDAMERSISKLAQRIPRP